MSLDQITRPAPPTHRVSTNVLVGSAIGTTGLLAGLYYGYAVSVMPALHASSDHTMVETMQEINRAIQNPVFFVTFMGAPAISLWAFLRARRTESNEAMRWVAAGLALNGLGLLISFAFNIPLNNTLDKAGDPARMTDIAAVRDHFENPWIAWNIVRTVVTTAAFGCLARVAFLRARTPR